MNGWSERVERIRQWRETVISLAAVAVVLGLLVNLLAASLFEKNWKVAGLFLLGTIALLAVTISFLYRRLASDNEKFECILPLAVDLSNGYVDLLTVAPYLCSSKMHEAMAVALRRESELKTSPDLACSP